MQSFSNAAYDFLRHFLPFSSHKSLQKQFGAVIKQYAHSRESLETIPHLLPEHILSPNTVCTLCIDAFSVDVFKRKNTCCEHAMSDVDRHLNDSEQIVLIADATKRRNEPYQHLSAENSSFLFLVSPLNVCHRVFPIHLKSHSSGSADAAIHSLCCRMMEIVSSHPSIQLEFCSVDGHQGYQAYFDADFQKLLPGIGPIQDLSPIVASQSNWHHLLIGDFLHIHKNARTRLFK
jgi:hypothetical protein